MTDRYTLKPNEYEPFQTGETMTQDKQTTDLLPTDIENSKRILATLCKAGSVTMSIPVCKNDEDMILNRVIKFAEQKVLDPEPVTGETSDGYHTFNELYEHRHALFSALALFTDSWKSKLHSDSTMFDGWFIAGINTPQGPATYHLPMRLWKVLQARELDKAPEWDGHTPSDTVNRMGSISRKPDSVTDAELGKMTDDQIAELAEKHGASVAWANDPEEFHHLIEFTPPMLTGFVAALRSKDESKLVAALRNCNRKLREIRREFRYVNDCDESIEADAALSEHEATK